MFGFEYAEIKHMMTGNLTRTVDWIYSVLRLFLWIIAATRRVNIYPLQCCHWQRPVLIQQDAGISPNQHQRIGVLNPVDGTFGRLGMVGLAFSAGMK